MPNLMKTPLFCPECDGEGIVEQMVDRGRINSVGAAIPDYDASLCAECAGSGLVECELCLRAAVGDFDGMPLCERHLEEAEHDAR